MKLASRRSSPSCSQIRFGWRGSVPAQPLPRWVESVAPAATASWICGAVRGRVADRHAHAGRDQGFDERERARRLGRERHEPDAPSAASLAPLEVVDVGAAHVLARVRAARAVLGRDVGPLHVDARDRGMPRSHERSGAGREALEGRRDERRQEARDAGLLDRRHRPPQVVRRRRRVAEVDTREAVDLQVDEARQLQRPGAGAGQRPRVRVAAAEAEGRSDGGGVRQEPAARRVGVGHAADRAT